MFDKQVKCDFCIGLSALLGHFLVVFHHYFAEVISGENVPCSTSECKGKLSLKVKVRDLVQLLHFKAKKSFNHRKTYQRL